jgi:hypothetical protein
MDTPQSLIPRWAVRPAEWLLGIELHPSIRFSGLALELIVLAIPPLLFVLFRTK